MSKLTENVKSTLIIVLHSRQRNSELGNNEQIAEALGFNSEHMAVRINIK